MSTGFAEENGLAVGSTVTIGYAGEETQVDVVATYVADSVLGSDVTMSLDGFDAIGVPPTDRTVYVVAQPGADRAALAAGLDARGRRPADGERQRPGRASPPSSASRSTGCSSSSTPCSASPW